MQSQNQKPLTAISPFFSQESYSFTWSFFDLNPIKKGEKSPYVPNMLLYHNSSVIYLALDFASWPSTVSAF